MRRSVPSVSLLPRFIVTSILCVLLLFVIAAPAVRAQQALLDSRAAEMAGLIERSPQNSVLVCDFSGPKGLTALGVQLADNFSESLVRAAGGKIQVIDRSLLPKAFEETWIPREIAGDRNLDYAIAKQTGVPNFITGRLSTTGDEISLSLELHRLNDVTYSRSLEASFDATPSLLTLLDTKMEYPLQNGYPVEGTGGYSEPKCVDCPNAPFNDAAVVRKFQGTVTLIALVGADGKVTSVHVLKGLPYGLDASTIQAVRAWKFVAATGPDGKPAATRVLIDVTFHLYDGHE